MFDDYYDEDEDTEDCAQCGRILRHISPREALYLATHPGEKAYCTDCEWTSTT